MTNEVNIVMFNSFVVFCSIICYYTGVSGYAFTALALAMVLDFIAGTTRAYKFNETISSRRMKLGVAVKIITMMLVLLVGFTFKNVIGLQVDKIDYTYSLITIVAISELYSILSNLTAIKTGRALPEWDALAIFAKLIRRLLNNIYSNKDLKDDTKRD